MQNLNVLYACDDNYAPYACVSICSLLYNNYKVFDNINIYVVLSGVDETNLNRLEKQIEQFGASFIPVDAEAIVHKIKELGLPEYRGSYAACFRLFFDMFINPDVDKFIYLDCDTIVVGSLKEIYQKEMERQSAFVVQDSLTNNYKTILGFSMADPYFNSGVMLINVKNWKDNKCSERMLDHLKNGRSAYCNPDQDLLNIILKDSIGIIGPEYNFQPIHRMLDSNTYLKIYNNPSYYSIGEIEAARKQPRILHTYRFLGEFPWNVNNRHPDTEIFDKYLSMSCQNDYKKKSAKLNITMKIEKILFNILPKNLFFRLFKLAQDYEFKKKDLSLKRQ